MNLSATLDALRVRHPAIDAVVYVDFGASTVLGASSGAGRPQEVLDGLCRVASTLFEAGHAPGEAVLMTLAEVLVLQRLPQEPGCALCVFFPPETAPETARNIARAAAGGLGS